jgi:predicted TIM-barrel fold metal-dependent hydrolase
VGQVEDGYKLDTIADTRFQLAQARKLGKPVALVAFVQLAAPDAEKAIVTHREIAGDSLVGVRMILNYDAADPSLCWPQVGRGDYLLDRVPAFKNGRVGQQRAQRRSKASVEVGETLELRHTQRCSWITTLRLGIHRSQPFASVLRQTDDPASAALPTVLFPSNKPSLRSPLLSRRLSLLVKHDLTFDLHCNWHQLADAAAFFTALPELPLIINHTGCVRLCTGDASKDAAIRAEWAAGLRALAALPPVSNAAARGQSASGRAMLKISCLDFAAAGWMIGQPDGPAAALAASAPPVAPGTPSYAERYALVRSLVGEAIAIFGVDRVMFDSNFPVDKFILSTVLPPYCTRAGSAPADSGSCTSAERGSADAAPGAADATVRAGEAAPAPRVADLSWGPSIAELYAALDSLVRDVHSVEERRAMFCSNARRAYRMDRVAAAQALNAAATGEESSGAAREATGAPTSPEGVAAGAGATR